jgi:dTDP-4-amino-4,6-dideoxygalactose transaminase
MMSQLAIKGGTPVRTAPYPAWPQFDDRERKGVLEVLEAAHWWATGGSKVVEFEQAWGRFHGLELSLACTNGTHAIELALQALDIGEGDEVIVPDYTFLATAGAVATVNAVPVPVDIDPATLCIDPDAVEAAIGERTAAVIVVHLAGHPADLDRLTDLCARHGLALIEDCAHAHGSSWRGQPVATFGDAGTYSFQQSKLLTAGEGGAVVAKDPGVLARARSFGDCGRNPGEWYYSHYRLGSNTRMTEWQAAVLLAQLDRFDEQHRRRNDNALRLSAELAEIPGVIPQARDERTTSQGYYCYVVRVDADAFGASREQVREALAAEGVPLTMSYPSTSGLDCFVAPDGFAPRYRTRTGFPDYAALPLPESRRAAAETLWVWHRTLLGSPDDITDVVEAFAKVHEHAHELHDAH